ncbi:MAG: SGNH/GDSL hydrolase family protein [Nitrospira sp.]|nr:SGNH/GDSL hydrolase family protein [Nitrospira sp.]
MNYVLLTGIYALEIASGILILGLFKKGDQPLNVFLSTTSGQVFLFGLIVSVISVGLIVFEYMKSRREGFAGFRMTTVLGVTPVVIIVLTVELSIRLLSTSGIYGETFLGLHLRPRIWEDQVARNREILKRMSSDGSYLQYDDYLGWSIGPNRRSVDGMYLSSAEGVRSPTVNMSMLTQKSKGRIVLIGDSFTFGEEVKFEETWGYFLQQYVGGERQVLNYGVPGYGLDQAYLRYLRDVRPLHPDIMVIGLISHDIERTMTVYNFISFPEWEFPFAKPRFSFSNGDLAILNSPVPSPEAITKWSSIDQLPFLEYDRGYYESEWDSTKLDCSYLFRFLTSKFPRWPIRSAEVSDRAQIALNSEILLKLISVAREDGTLPVVVFFPTHGTFVRMSSEMVTQEEELAIEVLEHSRVGYSDLTSCLMQVHDSERFVPSKRHYSPEANMYVAKCIAEDIADMGSG